jgi:hypothetical protein
MIKELIEESERENGKREVNECGLEEEGVDCNAQEGLSSQGGGAMPRTTCRTRASSS